MTRLTERAFDRREPCAKCPYRRDAPLAKWHPSHFLDLLQSERDMVGVVYSCHNADGNVCVGWALDQRERNVPSIAFRLHLRRFPGAAQQLAEITSGGHALFDSVQEMCRANIKELELKESSDDSDDSDEGGEAE